MANEKVTGRLGRRVSVGHWTGPGIPAHCGQPCIVSGETLWTAFTVWFCTRCCGTIIGGH